MGRRRRCGGAEEAVWRRAAGMFWNGTRCRAGAGRRVATCCAKFGRATKSRGRVFYEIVRTCATITSNKNHPRTRPSIPARRARSECPVACQFWAAFHGPCCPSARTKLVLSPVFTVFYGSALCTRRFSCRLARQGDAATLLQAIAKSYL